MKPIHVLEENSSGYKNRWKTKKSILVESRFPECGWPLRKKQKKVLFCTVSRETRASPTGGRHRLECLNSISESSTECTYNFRWECKENTPSSIDIFSSNGSRVLVSLMMIAFGSSVARGNARNKIMERGHYLMVDCLFSRRSSFADIADFCLET